MNPRVTCKSVHSKLFYNHCHRTAIQYLDNPYNKKKSVQGSKSVQSPLGSAQVFALSHGDFRPQRSRAAPNLFPPPPRASARNSLPCGLAGTTATWRNGAQRGATRRLDETPVEPAARVWVLPCPAQDDESDAHQTHGDTKHKQTQRSHFLWAEEWLPANDDVEQGREDEE